jgi:ribosomal protein S18 acetylase RimI-like enzyme
MRVRDATVADADGMSLLLGEILALWGSARPSSAEHLRAFYVEHPDRVSCVVAEATDGGIVGFQSLKRAGEGNPYRVTVGWGVIGTYVRIGEGRRGIATALFAATRAAAAAAGIEWIDASVAADNVAGLAYYAAQGFRPYRRLDEMIGMVRSTGGATDRADLHGRPTEGFMR